MRHSTCIALVVVLALCGCRTQVDLTVRNMSDSVPMGLQVQVLDRNGMQVRSVGLGDVAPHAEATAQFDVDNGSAFRVTADVSGRPVYRSSDVSVDGRKNPFQRIIEAKPVGLILDDGIAIQKLSTSFKNLGADIGAQPLSLKDALETRVGALVVAIPGTTNSTGKQLYTVSPQVLGVKVMSLGDVDFPATNETEATVISGEAITEFSGSYGPVAHLGLQWKKETVYELKWVMRGYGQVNKIEEPGKSPAVQFNLLPEAEMEQIKKILAANPASRIYYINRFYVLNRAEMFVKEGQMVAVGGDLDVANVVTAKAVYTFKESKEKNSGYGPVVLNYEGMELVPIQIPKDSTSGTGTGKLFAPPIEKTRKAYIDTLIPTGASRRFRPDQL